MGWCEQKPFVLPDPMTLFQLNQNENHMFFVKLKKKWKIFLNCAEVSKGWVKKILLAHYYLLKLGIELPWGFFHENPQYKVSL